MTTKYISCRVTTRVTVSGAVVRGRKIIPAVSQITTLALTMARTRLVIATHSTAFAIVVPLLRERSLDATLSSASAVASILLKRGRGVVTNILIETALITALKRARKIIPAITTASIIVSEAGVRRAVIFYAHYNLTTGAIFSTGFAPSLAYVTPTVGNAQNMGVAKVTSAVASGTHYINTGTLAQTNKAAGSVSFGATTAAADATITVTGIEAVSTILIEPIDVGGLAVSYLVDHSSANHTFSASVPGTYKMTIRMPTKEDVVQNITVT